MKNKIYENFSKEKFNELDNFNIIMSKVNEEKEYKNFKPLKIAVVIAIIMIGCITPRIYADIQYAIQFKEYQNREYEYGLVTLKDVVDNGYIENIDMEYIFQDGIGVKIDSLYTTGNHLEIKTNFVFPKDTEIDSEHFNFGYAIYDENSILYGIIPRLHIDSSGKFTSGKFKEYSKFLYKEIGIEIDKNGMLPELQTYSTAPNIYAENYNIISKIIMDTSSAFPQSKKIFIRIFDLGCLVYDENGTLCYDTDLQISNAEWIFELDVPERFYNSSIINLELKEKLPGININEIYVDDIKMRIDIDTDIFMEERNYKG